MIPVDAIRFGVAADLNWPEAVFLSVLAILGAFVGWVLAGGRSRAKVGRCIGRTDGMPRDREELQRMLNKAYRDGSLDARTAWALFPACDLVAHLERQRAWSDRTFGPGPRTAGILRHLVEEVHEAAMNPRDVSEWIDIVILGFDGAMRSTGATAAEVAEALLAKQAKNEARSWPDWRTQSPEAAIHHIEASAP